MQIEKGKTYKLIETGAKSATASAAAATGEMSTREAFAPAAVAAGAPAAGGAAIAAPGGRNATAGTGEVRFYGPVTFTMASANVADEVRRQLQTRKRA